jgi:hypothetical protein
MPMKETESSVSVMLYDEWHFKRFNSVYKESPRYKKTH